MSPKVSERLIIEDVNVYTPCGKSARRGSEMKEICVRKHSTVICDDGIIAFIGESGTEPVMPEAGVVRKIEGKGRALIPGFVDSHTHLVFGGYRPEEFRWRLEGDSYMSIMERGGGIQSTVNSTRKEFSEDKTPLYEKTLWMLDRMLEMGVTTVEVKSGYGLDKATELEMLRFTKSLQENKDVDIEIVSTYLGAHAVPSEYNGRTEEYIDYMISEVIPEAVRYAEFCDIFTEKNVFEIEESRRFMEAARKAGFKLKFHADEIVPLGGAELAAGMGAISADHLLHISDEGIKMMAGQGTVATLLPLTAFALKEQYAPARKMIDEGCAVALATDLNPGSCFSGSIPLTISLSCTYMGMSIEETLTALTLNGAAAIDRAGDRGSIEAGKRADLVLLHFPTIDYLPYYVGMNCVDATITGGRIHDVHP